MPAGSVRLTWREIGTEQREISGEVIEEAFVTLYLNGHELVTIMGTPLNLEAFGLGFLFNEGLIETLDDIDHVHVSLASCCVDIWTRHAVDVPKHQIVTSGCGGGITFDNPQLRLEPVESTMRLDPKQLYQLFNMLQGPDSLYARARGVHTTGLTDGNQILAFAEDVGRHNTIDKIAGICLQEGIEARDRVLLTTGRVSSEMLRKAARMGCPVIASRNSPTSLSIELAKTLHITLIGYVRRASMRVYTRPERMT
ncbi:MAG: formate dehydrogenase accessory sulfurtransferase FdhD [Anaerolineales bacterium]